ncbi:MAG: DUF3035 domain-containing protein, partial [Rhodospirillaceae bacterium]|nr:DUF3035 domain-containing protein [Rhodospirillaceae bacterium]
MWPIAASPSGLRYGCLTPSSTVRRMRPPNRSRPKMPKRFVPLFCLVAASLAVSGCQDTRRALGIDKSVPDEFAVVSRAPLVMPPDFNLRPPAPGAERPQEGTAADQARAILVGRERLNQYRARGFSAGEVKLLELAGTAGVPSDIRRVLDRETSAFAAEEKSFTDRLVFWRSEGEVGTP